MSGIDGEPSRERAAKHLVGRDQCAQALVNLPVLAFAPLLHRLHVTRRMPTPMMVMIANPSSVESRACQEVKSRFLMRRIYTDAQVPRLASARANREAYDPASQSYRQPFLRG